MTNALKVLPLAAGLITAALAGPALSQASPALSLLCPLPDVRSPVVLRPPCIFDSHKQPIGLAEAGSYLVRPIAGQWFRLYYDNLGLGGPYFYWTSPNCGAGQPAGSPAAQPYFNVGSPEPAGLMVILPQEAAYDGSHIWAPEGTPTAVKVASAGQGPASCGNYSSDNNPADYPTIVAQTAVAVQQLTLYPPLTLE